MPTAPAPRTSFERSSATLRQNAFVGLDQIARSDDFKFRRWKLDRRHKADLAGRLRQTGKPLDPILLWQDSEATQDEGRKLILLDGEHRFAAYVAVEWTGGVPAIILRCSRRTALLAALGGNARPVLPLTQAERTDAAWRLVREDVQPRYSRAEIVGLASVSKRTVNYMRSRWAQMVKAGTEPTGEWMRDRADTSEGDDVQARMSDAQRRREIETLVGELRDVLDRRKRPDKAILRDADAVDAAIVEAIGDQRFRQMAEYHLGTGADVDEWLDDASDGENENEDEDDEDAAF